MEGKRHAARLDGHVHIHDLSPPDPDGLLARLDRAGFDGCVLLSAPHGGFSPQGTPWSWRDRLDGVLAWTRGHDDLYPFFWIDPVAEDAGEQVSEACRRGIRGFKVICSRHCPGDPRAMPVYRAIAEGGRPILFHSGILWDGEDSARYNRPGEFESLLSVEGLRFALAHASWPWTDECIAVYGKFLNARGIRSGRPPEMFIDVTPGTPAIYREELLRKLYTVGYDVEDNLLFGSDGTAADFGSEWARGWAERDARILAGLVSAGRRHSADDGRSAEALADALFGGNLSRFLACGPEAERSPRDTPATGR